MRAGDHLLVTDSAYGPTRSSAMRMLNRYGIEHELLRSADRRGDRRALQSKYRVPSIVEAPGSLSFEMQDMSAIARRRTIRARGPDRDNTWATPIYESRLDQGIDLSIQAGTKYIGGHSDVMLGTGFRQRLDLRATEGTSSSSTDCASVPTTSISGLRGLRTLCGGARFVITIPASPSRAGWNSARRSRGLHPSRHAGSHPGYALWKRDFSGRLSGLFSVVFKPMPQKGRERLSSTSCNCSASARSWGGFESLAYPVRLRGRLRTATQWAPGGPTVRFHIGLEAVDDLLADLERGFAAMAAAV